MDKEVLDYYVEYFNKQEGRPYPCSNQIVVCGVITKNRDKALSIMKDKGAIVRWQNSDSIEWKLNNERWIWRIWNKNCRGYRFYKLLVDENIDEDTFYLIEAYAPLYCCSMEII